MTERRRTEKTAARDSPAKRAARRKESQKHKPFSRPVGLRFWDSFRLAQAGCAGLAAARHSPFASASPFLYVNSVSSVPSVSSLSVA